LRKIHAEKSEIMKTKPSARVPFSGVPRPCLWLVLLVLVVVMPAFAGSVSDETVTDTKKERFVDSGDAIIDTATGLMWALHDNGDDISWKEADDYCRQYTGGGFHDWRLPTQKELATLFDLEAGRKSRFYIAGGIGLTGCCVWASDKSGAKVASFDFDYGNPDWGHPASIIESRALPVRRVLSASGR